MSRKSIIYFFLLLAPSIAIGQVIDTAGEIKKLVSDLKNLRNLSYNYEMNISFPNGERDHLNGMIYQDNDDWRYFDDCDAFTMIYTKHWFYRADHRKKSLTVVNMDSDYDKRLKKATEKDIFQNGAVLTFLDSVVLKTATIKKFNQKEGIVEITLGFPKSKLVREMEITYDGSKKMPVKYNMTVYSPFQRTPKGVQIIETKIKCSDFNKVSNKHAYDESNYFSYKNGGVELVKFRNYKLSTKM